MMLLLLLPGWSLETTELLRPVGNDTASSSIMPL